MQHDPLSRLLGLIIHLLVDIPILQEEATSQGLLHGEMRCLPGDDEVTWLPAGHMGLDSCPKVAEGLSRLESTSHAPEVEDHCPAISDDLDGGLLDSTALTMAKGSALATD